MTETKKVFLSHYTVGDLQDKEVERKIAIHCMKLDEFEAQKNNAN